MMALLANCHRDPKRSRPYSPSDFNPYAPPPKPPTPEQKEAFAMELAKSWN